ncbi:transposase [Arthrobacter sp. UCD-GKA]|uniref:transposase n=1 Tax=Arthrobacter sp. UCD-GKA TaxID=1913576 RepID=UPI0009F377AF
MEPEPAERPRFPRGPHPVSVATSPSKQRRAHTTGAGVGLDAGPAGSNGEHNHVHLLASFPPTIEPTRPTSLQKSVSSRNLRRDHHARVQRFLWGKHPLSRSSYCGTVGGLQHGHRQPIHPHPSRGGRSRSS